MGPNEGGYRVTTNNKKAAVGKWGGAGRELMGVCERACRAINRFTLMVSIP